jgi:O-antigen ligase
MTFLARLRDPAYDRRFATLERAVALLGLLLAISVFNPLFAAGNTDASLSDSNQGRMLSLLVVYMMASTLLVRRGFDAIWEGVRHNPLLLALMLLALVSVLWSVAPDATLRRAIALGFTFAFVIFLAVSFTLREAIRLFGLAVLVFMAYSLFNVVTNPAEAIVQAGRSTGDWDGGLVINTEFGRFVAVGMMLFAAMMHDRGIWRVLAWGGFAVATVSLYKADVATALVSVVFGLGVIAVMRMAGLFRMTVGALVLLISLPIVAVAAYFLAYPQELFDLIGRDATLTDRTLIWNSAISYAMQEHPWMGAGFRAFWTIGHAQWVLYGIYFSFETRLGNGHNGFLDVWLELGVPGLALVILLLVSAAGATVRAATTLKDPALALFPAVVAFVIVYSTAERILLEHSEFLSILFMYTLVKTRLLLAAHAGAPDTRAVRILPDAGRRLIGSAAAR